MRLRCSTLRRRSLALALAYLLALQGILVAWGMVAAAAVHAAPGLPSIVCTSDGAPSPEHRPDGLPPCCPCGPLCGSGGGTAVGAAPQAEPTLIRHPHTAAAGWPLRPSDALPRISSDPRKARGPPAMA